MSQSRHGGPVEVSKSTDSGVKVGFESVKVLADSTSIRLLDPEPAVPMGQSLDLVRKYRGAACVWHSVALHLVPSRPSRSGAAGL
jgi:hypothetical protein